MFLYNDGDEKYIVCNGGFYQGFFKLYGHNYEVLPHKLDNEWVMHFNLRPRTDYDTPTNTVNYTHKNNDGIFFFMGLRAENKFLIGKNFNLIVKNIPVPTNNTNVIGPHTISSIAFNISNFPPPLFA